MLICRAGAWIVTLLLLLPGLCYGDPATRRVLAAGHIIQVISPTRVVINRGRLDGLTLDAQNLDLHPVRIWQQDVSRSVDTDVRLARGKVVDLQKYTAAIELSAVVTPAELNDYVGYVLAAPADVAQQLLFEIALFDIELRALDNQNPFFTLADLLTDHTPQHMADLAQKMLDELHSRAEIAKEVYTFRIEGGRFHGKFLADALLAAQPDDLKAFLHFVRSFPGKYVGQSFRLVEVYSTWVISKTPAGADLELERQVQPLENQAEQAMNKGDFVQAEILFRQALKLWPQAPKATKQMNTLQRLRIWQSQLTKDPDDVQPRWALAIALFDLEAIALAAEHLTIVEHTGFSPDLTLQLRAKICVRQRQFAKSIELFQKLLVRQPAAPVKTWLQYAELMQAQAGKAQTAAGAIALGDIWLSEQAYDLALARYRDALDLSKTADEFALARAAQARVGDERSLQTELAGAQSDLRAHNVASARKRLDLLLPLCQRIGNRTCASATLAQVADAAAAAWEAEFAIEMREKRFALAPEQPLAWTDWAWSQLGRNNVAQAIALLQQAEKKFPDDSDVQQKLAQAYMVAGQYAAALSHSEKAVRGNANWFEAARVRTRLEVVTGSLDRAWEMAQNAHKMADVPSRSSSDQILSRSLQRGVWLLQQAQAGLTKNQEVPRNRLRKVRALVELDLAALAVAEANKIAPESPLARDAQLAIANSGLTAPPLRLAAAEKAKADTPLLTRQIEQLRARLAYEQQANHSTQLRYAHALVLTGDFGHALGVLGTTKPGTLAADIEENARKGLHAEELNKQAAQASNREDYAEAFKLCGQAAALLEQVGYLPALGEAVVGVAMGLQADAKLDQALALLTKMAARLRADGDEENALLVEAVAASLTDDEATEKRLRDAKLQRALAEDDIYSLAREYAQAMTAAMAEGKLAAAGEFAVLAQKYADANGYRNVQMMVLLGRGNLAYQHNELKDAQAFAEKTLTLSRLDLDASKERDALRLLGRIAMDRSDSKTALRHFAEIYELGVRKGDVGIRARARYYQGITQLYALHDAKAALEPLQQAFKLYVQDENEVAAAQVRVHLAEINRQFGKIAEARADLNLALEVAKKNKRLHFIASIQQDIAWLEAAAGNGPAALAAAKDALAYAKTTEYPDDLWSAHQAMGHALVANKDETAALVEFEAAVAGLLASLSHAGDDDERQGRLGFGRTREVFRDAIDLHLRRGEVERALELIELARDANLRAMFDPAKLKPQNKQLRGALSMLQEAEAQASASKQALGEEMARPKDQRNEQKIKVLSEVAAKTDGEARQLLLRLKINHPQIYDLLAIKPESITDMRSSLPADTIVIEYFLATDALYAFVISKDRDKPRAFKVAVSAAAVEQAVYDYRHELDRDQTKLQEVSKQLYQWLLAPIEAEMGRSKTTLFVPSGALYYLPLHALMGSDADGKSFYALEKFRIGYLSSTTIFKLLNGPTEHAPRTLLAFANPDGTLQGAHAEVEQIKSKAFPDANALYEGAATKQKFFELAGNYGIIHFATHGVLDSDVLASHLKMAKDSLSVYEIAGFEGMEGHTELVVLSACQTAIEIGRSRGDELISIASAFSHAGAPSLIASLWDVDDESTAALMVDFYTRLRNDPKLDKLEALRQAQLYVLRLEKNGKRVFEAPTYWAAFALIGDFR